MTALIIEDDHSERSFLKKGLSEMGYDCKVAKDGADGLAMIRSQPYDLAIVDLMLPHVDGRDIIRTARADGITTPIIIVSNLGTTNDRIAGLNLGADAYLPKPCDMTELKAHINAFNRRFHNTKARILSAKGITLDTTSRICTRDGRSILLSKVEFAILECLMRNINVVVTKNMLLNEAWGYDNDYTTNVIPPHISRIRTKLTANGEDDPIENLRREGYIFHA